MSADVVWSGAPDSSRGVAPAAGQPCGCFAGWRHWSSSRLAVAAAVPWLDHRQRSRELAALTSCVVDGQSAVNYADASLRGMAQYISAGLGSSDSAEVRRSMFGLLSQAASAGVPGLDGALRSCAAVHVEADHHAVVDAKAAYLRWLGAKDAFYRAITQDARVARATPPVHAELLADATRALLASSTDPGRLRSLQSALAA